MFGRYECVWGRQVLLGSPYMLLLAMQGVHLWLMLNVYGLHTLFGFGKISHFFVNTILKFSQFTNAIRLECLHFHAACFVYLFRLSSLTRLKGYYTGETLTSWISLLWSAVWIYIDFLLSLQNLQNQIFGRKREVKILRMLLIFTLHVKFKHSLDY